MAREKIEMGLDEFLTQLRLMFGQNARRAQAGGGLVVVMTPEETAEWIVSSCGKFLGD